MTSEKIQKSEEYHHLQNEMVDLRERHNQTVQDYNVTIRDFEDQVISLQQTNSEHDALAEEQTKSLKELQNLNDSKDEEIQSLKTMMATLTPELNSATTELEIVKVLHTEVKQREESVNQEYENIPGQLKELVLELSEKTDQLCNVDKHLELEKNECIKLKSKIEEIVSFSVAGSSEVSSDVSALQNVYMDNLKAFDEIRSVCEQLLDTLLSISNFVDHRELSEKLNEIKKSRDFLKIDEKLLTLLYAELSKLLQK